MDTLRISSGLLGGLITKVIKKSIKKKTGLDITVTIKSLEIVNKDNRTEFELSLTGDVQSTELIKYISKNLGV